MIGIYRVNTDQWFAGWENDKPTWVDDDNKDKARVFQNYEQSTLHCERLQDEFHFAVIVDTIHE